MNSRSGQGGFTLIEVLVAVAIFAIIGVVSAGLLRQSLQVSERVEARTQRLAEVQRAMQVLERDVLQYTARGIRDEFGDPLPAMELDADGILEFSRTGWHNPLELPRPSLRRVAWRLAPEGVLQRRLWPVLDRDRATLPTHQDVARQVSALEWRIQDQHGQIWTSWPPEASDASAALPGVAPDAEGRAPPFPVALRMAMDVRPWGRIERVWLIAHAAPEVDEPVATAAPETEETEPSGDAEDA